MCAGERGSAARHLSAQMRKSGSFFVEVIVDLETTRHILFQSGKMRYNDVPTSTTRTQKCLHTPDTIGECAISFEKCQYDNNNLLKRIDYIVLEQKLRSFFIGISGGLN